MNLSGSVWQKIKCSRQADLREAIMRFAQFFETTIADRISNYSAGFLIVSARTLTEPIILEDADYLGELLNFRFIYRPDDAYTLTHLVASVLTATNSDDAARRIAEFVT